MVPVDVMSGLALVGVLALIVALVLYAERAKPKPSQDPADMEARARSYGDDSRNDI